MTEKEQVKIKNKIIEVEDMIKDLEEELKENPTENPKDIRIIRTMQYGMVLKILETISEYNAWHEKHCIGCPY